MSAPVTVTVGGRLLPQPQPQPQPLQLQPAHPPTPAIAQALAHRTSVPNPYIAHPDGPLLREPQSQNPIQPGSFRDERCWTCLGLEACLAANPSFLLALYPFKSRADGELSFAKGEQMRLLDKTSVPFLECESACETELWV